MQIVNLFKVGFSFLGGVSRYRDGATINQWTINNHNTSRLSLSLSPPLFATTMIREQPSSKDKLSVSPSTSQIKMTAPSSTNPPVPNSPSQGRVAIAVQTTEEKLKNSPPSPVAPVRSGTATEWVLYLLRRGMTLKNSTKFYHIAVSLVVPRENSQGSKLTFKGAAKAVRPRVSKIYTKTTIF